MDESVRRDASRARSGESVREQGDLGAVGDRATPADALEPGDTGGSSRESGVTAGARRAGDGASPSFGDPGSRADRGGSESDSVTLGPADEASGSGDVGGD